MLPQCRTFLMGELHSSLAPQRAVLRRRADDLCVTRTTTRTLSAEASKRKSPPSHLRALAGEGGERGAIAEHLILFLTFLNSLKVAYNGEFLSQFTLYFVAFYTLSNPEMNSTL